MGLSLRPLDKVSLNTRNDSSFLMRQSRMLRNVAFSAMGRGQDNRRMGMV